MKIATLVAFILFLICVPIGTAQDSPLDNPNLVSKVEWSSSGNLILIATQREGISVLDALTQSVVTSIPSSETRVVWDAALSPDETLVAAVSENPFITLWNARTGALVRNLEGNFIRAGGVAWSPDGNLLAMSSAPDSRVWELSSGRTLFTMPSGEEFPEISFSSDGKLARSSSQQIEIWDVASQQMLRRMRVPGLRSSIQWSKDNSRLLVANLSLLQEGNFYTIQILDAETGEIIQESEGFPDRVISAAWNADETQILSTSLDGVVRITDVISGETSIVLESDIPVLSADWSPFGGQIAVGTALGSTANLEGDAVQMSRNIEAELVIVVPAPSLERLQAIADACNAPAAVERVLPASQAAGQLSEFVGRLEALPENTIPPACAADLIAVAEALQSR